MSEISDIGNSRIQKVIDHFSKVYSKSRFVFIESSGIKESIEMTAFVKCLRGQSEGHVILWGINQSLYKQFDLFAAIVGCVVFPLPDADSKDRKIWLSFFESNKFVHYSSINGPIKAGKQKPTFPINDYNSYDDLIKPLKNKNTVLIDSESNVDLTKISGVTVLSIGPKALNSANSIDINYFTLKQLKMAVDKSKLCIYHNHENLGLLFKCEEVKISVINSNTPDLITKINSIGME